MNVGLIYTSATEAMLKEAPELAFNLSDAPETGAAEVGKWSKVVQLDHVGVQLDSSAVESDHTFHLRSLATQVAGGIHVELASKAIHELLRQESALEGDQMEALYRVIRGALD